MCQSNKLESVLLDICHLYTSKQDPSRPPRHRAATTLLSSPKGAAPHRTQGARCGNCSTLPASLPPCEGSCADISAKLSPRLTDAAAAQAMHALPSSTRSSVCTHWIPEPVLEPTLGNEPQDPRLCEGLWSQDLCPKYAATLQLLVTAQCARWHWYCSIGPVKGRCSKGKRERSTGG